MRLQGNKQDRCQLWVAAVCQNSDGKWKWIAVLGGKAAKKSQRLKPQSFQALAFLPMRLRRLVLLLQQLEHRLLGRVGLGQNGGGSLLHDLRAGELG